MNAVEIEAAVSELAEQPFDPAEFPFSFLAAFGNKDTALKRLRTGNNNASDVPDGVLQRNNIHIAVCAAGTVGKTLKALRESPATTKARAKFILATDGQTLEAEELASGETIACHYPDFPNHFGFFLPLAGISTIKEIKDNPIDVRATGRLNKLYVELRAQLEAAGENKTKLLNLRKRMARIRVFDPACGSGNFLVIAYKQMREIEAEINRRRGSRTWAAKFHSPTSGASSCATSRRRLRGWRSSSPSSSATCSIADRRMRWRSFCRWMRRTGSSAAMRCGWIG